MTAEPKKPLNRTEPTALVAGGAGFIGSHLCKALLEKDFRVYCVDNLSSGSKENIKDLLTKQKFHFAEGDITSSAELLESLPILDAVFHLAALEPSAGDDFSLETLLVNSIGSRNLLELAKKDGSKFILVSSGDIYQGSFSSSSFKNFFGEGQEAVMSQHEAKRFAEALTVEYAKKYRLGASIVRVKDVYGPSMNLKADTDLSRLIREAKEREKLSIRGDGLATINPTYISDVVFGLLKVAQGEFPGEIFNIISVEKATVNGLAETLRLVVGNLEIVHEDTTAKLEFPPPPLDIEASRQRLKWSSRVTLAEGLSSTLQAFGPHEPAKMVELAPEVAVNEVRIEASHPHHQARRNWLRLLVFISSLLLIIFTIVVPFFLFIFQSTSATGKLNTAYQKLETEEIDSSLVLANQALSGDRAAQKNLNNLRWLFQLSGQRESLRSNEQFLFGTENTSTAVRLLVEVSQAIVQAELETNPNQSVIYLHEAKEYLIEANQNLDLAAASLDQANVKKLTPLLTTSFHKAKEIKDKATKRAASIGISLEATLEKVEAASTEP